MESIIIDKETLSETIFSYIHSEKICLTKENDGTIILSPVEVQSVEILEKSFGMFSDGKLSSESFIQNKTLEKELEE
ncbi:MAG: hypothetical protein LBV04_02870 [Deferribacteraceae bacterium]|jgi:hypothetical protein|nr:hypothetical protein [Deferribacteraceae bacterium]